MAAYVDIDSVVDGNVRLSLKVRTDTTPNFKCLTWRERRVSSGTNRRFYLEQGEFWSLPLSQARHLLEFADAKGLFGSKGERWPGAAVQTIDSTESSSEAKGSIWGELLTDSDLDAVWLDASDRRALVGVEPNGLWRKVLIFSRSLNLATLRSLTRDLSYMNTYRFPLLGGWRIDRSMLDGDAEIHAYFLSRM